MKAVALPAKIFHRERLGRHIGEDRTQVANLVASFEGHGPENDAKLQRLKKYLGERSPGTHRVLLFTQYADTAIYLGKALGNDFGRTEVGTGGTRGLLSIARRFAPRANRQTLARSEELDFLISTDALSEGVNLQDADTVINYDLHWNPVRLIQRAGRIDRLGSENEEIHIASFLPEKGLEERLGLEAVLRRRIREFMEVFGEDSNVLPTNELPDAKAMVAAYTGEALEEPADDDLDGLSRHIERLLKLRRSSPDRYAEIREMRVGRRSISCTDAPDVVACRLGWFWGFYVHKGNTLEVTDDLAGLDILYRHAQDQNPCTQHRSDEEFARIVGKAMNRFKPLAVTFEEQRAHPRLSPPEDFVLKQLDEFAAHCPRNQVDLLDSMRRWIVEGQAKVRLQRLGRLWRKECLAPESVVQELKSIFARFPRTAEDLGDSEILGAVLRECPQ